MQKEVVIFVLPILFIGFLLLKISLLVAYLFF